MLDSILGIIIQHLDEVVVFSSTILPVQLADLGIAMEQVQTALATTTATSTDLANAIRLDGHVVDLIFVKRLATVSWAVEFTADGMLVERYMMPDNPGRLRYPSMTVFCTVISPPLRWSRMWKETHWEL
jgi:hypothetical protein